MSFQRRTIVLTVDYEAEFASKMDMYLEALDRDYKKPNENPSVGIILCPSADKAEVEYSINRSMSPTMVAEYKRFPRIPAFFS